MSVLAATMHRSRCKGGSCISCVMKVTELVLHTESSISTATEAVSRGMNSARAEIVGTVEDNSDISHCSAGRLRMI